MAGAERGLRRSRDHLVSAFAEGSWVELAARSPVVQHQEGLLGIGWSTLDGFIADLSRGRGMPEMTS